MRVNLYLFKKDISPKNLPIFTSPEDRETYFSASNADKAYTNISYNGTRNIRLNVNAFEANLDYYNYARINWIDKEGVKHNYYCFIDIVKYVNDNVSELQMTLDYVTTYYFDIKLNEFNLKQCTMQDSMVDRRGIETDENYRVYFENKIPCVYKPSKAIPLCHDIQLPDASCKLKWLIVNIAPSSSDTNEVYQNNGTRVISIITPAIYDSNSEILYKGTIAYVRDSNNSDKRCDITSILNYYDGRILNISMIDNPFVDTEIKVFDTDEELPTTLRNDVIYVKKLLDVENINPYYVYIPKDLQLPTTKFSYLILSQDDNNAFVYMRSHINYSIFFRGSGVLWLNDVSNDYKYASLIKNGNEEVLQFSPQDFEMTEVEQGRVSITVNIDPIYPNNMMISLFRDGVEPLNKKLKNVIIPPTISGIQFDQTKWGEYYVQNSASVNDGLATKHKYDLENAEKQRQSSHIQGALNFAGGATGALATVLGAEKDAGLIKGVGQAIQSGFALASNITATEYAYQIAENNIQKEKELLQLSWNDIKASPNSMYNYGAGNNIISMIDYGYVLYIMEPVDMNNVDMKKYHMIYGYKINRKFAAQNEANFKGINDIMLAYENKNDTLTDIKYKFIRLESDFVIDNLPLTVRKMLKEIFADGVKFYNKDNMLISVNPSFNNYIE